MSTIPTEAFNKDLLMPELHMYIYTYMYICSLPIICVYDSCIYIYICTAQVMFINTPDGR